LGVLAIAVPAPPDSTVGFSGAACVTGGGQTTEGRGGAVGKPRKGKEGNERKRKGRGKRRVYTAKNID